MPEAAAWQFKETKRVPDRRSRDGKVVLKGRLFTGEVGGVVEDGFVRIDEGRITGVGRAADLGSGGDGDLYDINADSAAPKNGDALARTYLPAIDDGMIWRGDRIGDEACFLER